MKLLCAWLLVTCSLLSQVVEGTVINDSSAAPLAAVSVRIQQSGKSARTATTDPQGIFRLEDVTPGNYTVTFSKSGFSQLVRKSILVATGSNSVHVDARLTPLAKLSGRVTDAERRPIKAADVQLQVDGSFTGETRKADDQGKFSFTNIDPGTYTLSARAPKDAPAPPSQGDQRMGWVRTWYPSVAYRHGGAKIALAPGADLQGEDIELRAVPVHRLRGRVLDVRGEPVPRAPVKLYPSEELSTAETELEIITAADGTFEFPGLHDGSWRLKAAIETGGVSLLATAYQQMTGRDVDRLELRLIAPFTVPGKVTIETPQGAPAPKAVGVMLAPAGGGDHIPHGLAKADGSLTVEGVTPDAYRIMPIGPGTPYYLASIQVGSRDAMTDYVEFSPGSPPITITYKSDGGSVRGSVEDCGSATVTLAPQQSALLIGEFIQRASCDANGRFQIANIRPGEYYAYAFDRAPGILEYSKLASPSIANQAVRVTVRPGESTSISLKVTSLASY